MNDKVKEAYWPLAFSLIIAIVYFFFMHGFSDPKLHRYILTSTISVSGIAIGFLSTSQSILLTIRTSKIVRYLRNSGVYEHFKKYIREAIYSCFALLSLSFIGLTNNNWCAFWVAVWVFTLMLAGSNCFRAVSLFQKLLNRFDSGES